MMKIYIKNFKSISLVLTLILSSCSQEFLDRTSEDGYVASNFYANDAQVIGTTNGMYGKMWSPFYNKSFYALTELSSGNLWANVDGNDAIYFKLTSDSFTLNDSWTTCYAVVAQSNVLINSLEANAKPGVSPAVVKNTIAEAHFFRAVAYFYLVRLFGPVPIIEDNLVTAKDPLVNNNRVEDVYTLMKRDLTFAMNNLTKKIRSRSPNLNNAFLSKGSAEALLAKVYLYEKDYPNAILHSKNVIDSGEFDLLPNFGDLFLTSQNNNQESIYSWQWGTSTGTYQAGNPSNVQYGLDVLNDRVSYGAVYTPTNDIQDTFETGDLRRKESFMKYGDEYPNMKADGPNGTANVLGFYPTKEKYKGLFDATGAAVKKYVVGQETSETGPSDAWGAMNNCNYILRYADVLLIYAEAKMGSAPATNDSEAIDAYNKVRKRAGLTELKKDGSTPLTHVDLIHERRVEFAFEGEYWFDLGRLPRAEAIALCAKQDRGADWEGVRYYTPVETDFIYPKPAIDVRKNPKLKEAPVPYIFK